MWESSHWQKKGRGRIQPGYGFFPRSRFAGPAKGQHPFFFVAESSRCWDKPAAEDWRFGGMLSARNENPSSRGGAQKVRSEIAIPHVKARWWRRPWHARRP